MINDNTLIQGRTGFVLGREGLYTLELHFSRMALRICPRAIRMFPYTSFATHEKVTLLQQEIRSQEHQSDSMKWRLEETERQLGRTMLAVEALFEILVEKGLVTTAELFARIDEIDLRDGKKDGKIGPVALECQECGRPVSSKSAKCMYCGEDRPRVAGITAG